MFLDESLWIKEILDNLGEKKGKTALDLGSTSRHYRSVQQPYIEQNVFAPLRKAGAKISYLDMQKQEGIDLVCDLATAKESEIKKIGKFDIVICASLLEHVSDIKKVVKKTKKLAKQNGIIILTVPHNYPIHATPIDNGFRPTSKELEKFFPKKEFKKIDSRIIEITKQDAKTRISAWLKKNLKIKIELYRVSAIAVRKTSRL